MNAVRRCLMDLDTAGICELWSEFAPHLPQPRNKAEALISLHYARTLAESIPFRQRAYSHAWLTERDYPSGLPDALRPAAERTHPRVVSAVAIFSLAGSALTKPIASLVQDAMVDAVKEMAADGVSMEDRDKLLPRMMEARTRTVRQLLGAKIE